MSEMLPSLSGAWHAGKPPGIALRLAVIPVAQRQQAGTRDMDDRRRSALRNSGTYWADRADFAIPPRPPRPPRPIRSVRSVRSVETDSIIVANARP